MKRAEFDRASIERRGFKVFDGGDDLLLLSHPTGVTVLTLADSHPVMNKSVVKVGFQVSRGGPDRSRQKVTGKGKKGGLQLMSSTRICVLTCNDGSEYPIRSPMVGTLIQVNERLLHEPDLCTRLPQDDGYIAVILPKMGRRYAQK